MLSQYYLVFNSESTDCLEKETSRTFLVTMLEPINEIGHSYTLFLHLGDIFHNLKFFSTDIAGHCVEV